VEDVMFPRRDGILGATAKVGEELFPVLGIPDDKEDNREMAQHARMLKG
jgi:hypothetical protein